MGEFAGAVLVLAFFGLVFSTFWRQLRVVTVRRYTWSREASPDLQQFSAPVADVMGPAVHPAQRAGEDVQG